MRLLVAASVLSIMCAACSHDTPLSPSLSSPTPPGLSGDPTIGFDGLNQTPCSARSDPAKANCVVHSYAEPGVTVTATSGEWFATTNYGQPAPFIEFDAPSVCTRPQPNESVCLPPATPTTGSVQVTAGGAAFTFKSVDLYASMVRIPYEITGLLKSATVFTVTNTLPNTFGDFATVMNPHATDAIDTLVITLTDAGGPMGLDNIVVAPGQ